MIYLSSYFKAGESSLQNHRGVRCCIEVLNVNMLWSGWVSITHVVGARRTDRYILGPEINYSCLCEQHIKEMTFSGVCI